MSGGSFDYLCMSYDVGTLLARQDKIGSMAQTLRDWGHDGAAGETEALLAELKHLDASVMDRVERLRAVWKAVEWTVSCDWGPDSVGEAVQELALLRTVASDAPEGLSRLEGFFVPLQRHWVATNMDTPKDVDYLYRRTGRKPDFTGLFDRGKTSIRLAGSVFLEEVDLAGSPTGRWNLVLKGEFSGEFAHTDDLAARLRAGDLPLVNTSKETP